MLELGRLQQLQHHDEDIRVEPRDTIRRVTVKRESRRDTNLNKFRLQVVGVGDGVPVPYCNWVR